jgi:very-short-patch-repair endonuclease
MQRKTPLRRASADIETRLWAWLRVLNLRGYRFRRRVPFHSFILPFVEHERLLVIEIRDGEPGRAPPRSIARDHLLAGAGYTVLRFWRVEVERNFSAMAGAIECFLEER